MHALLFVNSKLLTRLLLIILVAGMTQALKASQRNSPENMALLAPKVNTSPGPEYSSRARHWQGIPGIERSENGRLWATWYSGGQVIPEFNNAEGPDNYVLLVTSDDGGKNWSEPVLVIDPEGKVRAFDPVLWHDPQGRLWLFWSQCYDFFDTRGGVWAIVTENSNAANPTWSAPRRLCGGIMMNKPTVLDNGQWLLPAALWRPEAVFSRLGYMHTGAHIDVRSNVYASDDNGQTWFRKGGAEVPDRNCDEHMIVERKDGSLWMLVRTNYGIGESFSNDGGKTWTPGQPSEIQHTVSRFFIRRLDSGNLLLVKHGKIDQRARGRTDLMAFISKDDGKTWQGGLMLDERNGISYPDGVQGSDGMIYIIYDYSRFDAKEIYMAIFTEADVIASKVVDKRTTLKKLINKAK